MVFARAGDGSERFAATGEFFSGGIAWEAPFGRKRDFAGVALAWGRPVRDRASPDRRGELIYRWQLTSRVALSPDVQYLACTAAGRDSQWVVGVRGVFVHQF
jgi:carbohydrate-selective porin OprB